MHPRLSLHQVAFMSESTVEFLTFCQDAGFANAVLAAPKLVTDGITTLPDGAPFIASLNQIFDADSFDATLVMAAQIGAKSVYLLTGSRGSLDWEDAAARFAAQVAPELARGLPVLVENPFCAHAGRYNPAGGDCGCWHLRRTLRLLGGG
jgi:hypothetical protein